MSVVCYYKKHGDPVKKKIPYNKITRLTDLEELYCTVEDIVEYVKTNCENKFYTFPPVTNSENVEIEYFKCLKTIPNDFKNLKTLTFYRCPHLIRIPSIEGLESLDITRSVYLEEIPGISTLKKLKLNGCVSVKSLPQFISLESLVLINSNIEELPRLSKLISLKCINCPYIDYIPTNHNLKKLILQDSPIQKIPELENLNYLECTNCFNLTELPIYKNLKTLLLENCSITILSAYGLEVLKCINCMNLIYIRGLTRKIIFTAINCPNLFIPKGFGYPSNPNGILAFILNKYIKENNLKIA